MISALEVGWGCVLTAGRRMSSGAGISSVLSSIAALDGNDKTRNQRIHGYQTHNAVDKRVE